MYKCLMNCFFVKTDLKKNDKKMIKKLLMKVL